MPYQMRCDAHTHTLFSRHAYSTITENADRARAVGLELLGSADHFSAMLFPEAHIRNYQFFLNTTVWPRVWDGLVLLRGAEVDIVSIDGDLFGQGVPCPESIVGRRHRRQADLFERVTAGLDYLVASIHNGEIAEGASLARTTAMYVAALEDPKVFILGHTGRSGVPFDIDEVLAVAREKHKLIELNEHSLASDPSGTHVRSCRAIAERCAELGVGITVSTDAHIAHDIGRAPRVIEMLEEIHFPEELVMSRSAVAFLGELAAAGIKDLRDLAPRAADE
ncbi:MAG: phosphatase [Collinsella sp.]|nr:phosphatase [Collinsella sp.]